MKKLLVLLTPADLRRAARSRRSRRGRLVSLAGGTTIAVCAAAAAITAAAWANAAPVVRPVVLPRDQGAHPGFGVEWWYTSGTLTGTNRRAYFWFATIWSGTQGLVAKLNVVDLRADRAVLSHEYISTTPATSGQQQFQVEGFRLALRPGSGLAPWSINAAPGHDGAFALELLPRQPYVLHGHAGIIQQGTGGPSAYYSNPRLVASGILTIAGKKVRVHGQGWLDHQWGNFGTDAGALRWNWFACQFRSGADLMLYQFLNGKNRPSGRETGTLVTQTGAVEHLARFSVIALRPSIRPPGATATYPLSWRLRVPAGAINITIRARARDQFITNQFVPSFWEAASSITSGGVGACTVESSREPAAPS